MLFDDLNRVASEVGLENATPAPSVSVAAATKGGMFTLSLGGELTGALGRNASPRVNIVPEAISTAGIGNVDDNWRYIACHPVQPATSEPILFPQATRRKAHGQGIESRYLVRR